MSLHAPISAKGCVALAICSRCRFKIAYADLRQDPNDKNWYCKDCVDLYDPYRLPARKAEDVSLQHPRPDVELE